ncbi:MAG: hypothetical protein N2558_00850 [Patescibacteria group bacterium]|nr:hypothetical protein [Patescibacteria group bacterium]
MFKKVVLIFFLSVFACYFFCCTYLVSVVKAETQQESLLRLSRQIEEYQREILRLQSQSSTLVNQISQFDAQIKLMELKIKQTEEKISLLVSRIHQLENSINALSDAFRERVVFTYKISRFSEPYFFVLASEDLKSAMSNYFYLKKLQDSDKNLLIKLQNAQETYLEEKDDQEKLQKQLVEQKKSLDQQKNAKAYLLAQTKNDEKKYQSLLAQAKSEYEAIQAIIAGRGAEEAVGPVSAGQRIATIIQGPSCNSNGSHLHFIVARNGTTLNPFEFLKLGVAFENCSGSSCGSTDGDPFNPSGSWDWPILPSIRFTQGYGLTWAIRNTWVGKIYNFHNGIDIDSTSSSEVRAVQSGKLYRGSYTGINGCRLRYVRVDHDNSDLETFYLHINY